MALYTPKKVVLNWYQYETSLSIDLMVSFVSAIERQAIESIANYKHSAPAFPRIIVVDKQDAHARKGIFVIDASAGFMKNGPKNRLRAQDIHKIVDVSPRVRLMGSTIGFLVMKCNSRNRFLRTVEQDSGSTGIQLTSRSRCRTVNAH